MGWGNQNHLEPLLNSSLTTTESHRLFIPLIPITPRSRPKVILNLPSPYATKNPNSRKVVGFLAMKIKGTES